MLSIHSPRRVTVPWHWSSWVLTKRTIFEKAFSSETWYEKDLLWCSLTTILEILLFFSSINTLPCFVESAKISDKCTTWILCPEFWRERRRKRFKIFFIILCLLHSAHSPIAGPCKPGSPTLTPMRNIFL